MECHCSDIESSIPGSLYGDPARVRGDGRNRDSQDIEDGLFSEQCSGADPEFVQSAVELEEMDEDKCNVYSLNPSRIGTGTSATQSELRLDSADEMLQWAQQLDLKDLEMV